MIDYGERQLKEKVEEFLRLLIADKKLQKLYSFKADLPKQIDRDILKELLEYPYCLTVNDEDGELYFISDEDIPSLNIIKGENKCPEITSGITECKEWISDKLPLLNFDIDQGGNIRRAKEAESIYICTLIAGILRGSFEDEIYKIGRAHV